MFKITFLLLGLLLLGFAACKVYKQKTVVKSNSDILASYSKGSCFGKCPVFEFLVFENGEAIYIGEENVDMIGTYTASLDSAQMSSLKIAFEKSGFKSFEEEYLSNVSDLTIISIEYRQKVCDFHRRKAPKELWKLTAQLDGMMEQLQWIKK